MIGYIVGIIIGSLVMVSGMIFLLISSVKNRSFKKIVKSIGQKAEDKINGDVKIWAKHSKNKFLPASLYKYDENKVFEVDSILITDKALIVIEIKSIRGGIKGDANNQKWEKILGEKNFPIQNPVIQNDKHIKHIVKMSSIRIPTVSLIVFSNRTEFISIKNIPEHVVITREIDLFKTLDDLDSSLKVRLNKNEIKTIFKTIKTYKTNSRKDIVLHKKITNQIGGKRWKY